MASIVISGDTSGSITLSAPAVSGSSVLTLPAVTDTVAGIAATQTLTNKTLTSPTLTTPNINSAQFATVTGTAPIYPCRAWVNFNGTGTVAIRGSGNVSSITDNGTGDYTVNFTTAMPDVNYATMLTGAGSSGGDYPLVSILTAGNPNANNPTLYSTTQVRIRMSSSSPTVANLDTTYYGVAIFR